MGIRIGLSFFVACSMLWTVSFPAACQEAGARSANRSLPKIAFSSQRDGNSEIYVMNSDGSAQIRLTDNDAKDWYPFWSPDGEKIVYQSSETEDGPAQLVVMNADGSDAQQITDGPYTHSSPSWSPDGKRIAFHSTRGGGSNVFIVDADGGNETQLTNVPGYNFISPTWSPDGKRIAVEGGKRDEKIQVEWGEARLFQIWVVSVDDEKPPVQITDNVAYNGYPAWSPKGDVIAFDSNPGTGADVVSVKLGNEKIYNLTDQPTQSEFAAWAPDASKIAFVANRDGNNEIYIMNADGSEQTRLTFNDVGDTTPAWAPIVD